MASTRSLPADLRKRLTPLIRKTQSYNGRFAMLEGWVRCDLTDPTKAARLLGWGPWLSQSN